MNEKALKRFLDSGLIRLLLLSLTARLSFLLSVPAGAVSADLAQNWVGVAHALRAHQNPYNVTSFLNWPPLWMQLIFALDHASRALGVPFERAVQTFLITVDLFNLAVAFRLLRTLRAPRAELILAIGIALNPVQIFLTCQHCNFDVIVAGTCLLGVSALVRFHRDGELVDWLSACLFFGFGILAKVVPIALVPLLLARARTLGLRALFVGAVLTFFPVALGMSIIYVLGTDEVTRNVLEYRSFSGWFGVTGLLHLGRYDSLIVSYTHLFSRSYALLLAALAFGFVRAMRPLPAKGIVLTAALLLLAVPAFGPGYGPQYLGWSLPLLACAFALEDDRWFRGALLIFAIVAAFTCAFEYGLFPSHGSLWLKLSPTSQKLAEMSVEWSSQAGQTRARFPLFLAFLLLIAGGVRAVARMHMFATSIGVDEPRAA